MKLKNVKTHSIRLPFVRETKKTYLYAIKESMSAGTPIVSQYVSKDFFPKKKPAKFITVLVQSDV